MPSSTSAAHFRLADTCAFSLTPASACCLPACLAVQSGDLAALDSFIEQFDRAAFRKGLEISFTATLGGKLVTKFDGQEVRGRGSGECVWER